MGSWIRLLIARAWTAAITHSRPAGAAHVPRRLAAAIIGLLVSGGLAAGSLGANASALASRDRAPANGTGLDEVVAGVRVAVSAAPVVTRLRPAPAAVKGRPRTAATVAAAAPVARAELAAPNPPRPQLPAGKGIWVYVWRSTERGDPTAVVRRAVAAGVSSLYVRLGSTKDGFTGGRVLDALLPVAHAAGVRVVGWDFPELRDPAVDSARGVAMVRYRTPSGDGIDAFSSDIETRHEGTSIGPVRASTYGSALRSGVGPSFALIATVPRPSAGGGYPYTEVIASFDAIAPMVYWMARDPVAELNAAMDAFAPFGKPILPIGQAYDGGPEGGPPGAPPGAALTQFMNAAASKGALGVSFWVWQQATPDEWSAVAAAKHWDLAPMSAGADDAASVSFLQRMLSSLGYTVPVDGRYGDTTSAGVAAFQHHVSLPITGALDATTIARLLHR